MSICPTKGLINAYHIIKLFDNYGVKWGNKKEHELYKFTSRKNTDSCVVSYVYIHYNTKVCQIDVYLDGYKQPFLLDGYSRTDSNIINGLFKIMEIKEYKAIIKNGSLKIVKVEW